MGEWSDTGSLGLAEFLVMFSLATRAWDGDAELRAAFAFLDADRLGHVSVAHLISVFQSLDPSVSHATAANLIARAFPEEQAANFRAFVLDRTLTAAEFAKMMTQ